MPFEKNVIVQFLGGGGDLKIITKGSDDLDAKVEAVIVSIDTIPEKADQVSVDLRTTLKEALGKLTPPEKSRLYLRGHGDWVRGTMGGWNPEEMATLLGSCNLPTVKLISVTGCTCARNVAFGKESSSTHGSANLQEERAARQTLLEASLESFAGKLHRILGRDHNIRCDLYGRPYTVNILGPDMKTDGLRDLYEKFGQGAKSTANSRGHEAHKRTFSKIRFYWKDNQQLKEWVRY